MSTENSRSAAVVSGQPARATSPRHTLTALLLVTGILSIGLNLRPLFTSLSVVLPEAMSALSLSAAVAGLLTTLPVFCLGVFAPLAATLSARWSIERTLLAVILAIAGGSALRAGGSLPALFAGTFIGGAAIAMGNVLVPALIKRDFPGRVRSMTGLYVTTLCGGGALGAGLTVPMAHWLGTGWDGALALWAVPALVATLLWLPQAFGGAARAHGMAPRPAPVQGLWRDAMAWNVTLFMGLQSLLAYAVMGWLAPILRWRGLDAVAAGAMVSTSMLAQAAAALLTPALIARAHAQSWANAGSGALALGALLLTMFGPLAWLWPVVIALGVGQGALITLGLTVILLRAPDARVAASLSAMAQGVGYALASTGPLIIGAVRNATGGFAATALLYALTGLGVCFFGWRAGAPRFVLSGRGQ